MRTNSIQNESYLDESEKLTELLEQPDESDKYLKYEYSLSNFFLGNKNGFNVIDKKRYSIPKSGRQHQDLYLLITYDSKYFVVAFYRFYNPDIAPITYKFFENDSISRQSFDNPLGFDFNSKSYARAKNFYDYIQNSVDDHGFDNSLTDSLHINESNENITQELKSRLENVIEKYLIHYGFDKEGVKNEYTLEVRDFNDGTYRIIVDANILEDDIMQDLGYELEEVAKQYDENACFDYYDYKLFCDVNTIKNESLTEDEQFEDDVFDYDDGGSEYYDDFYVQNEIPEWLKECIKDEGRKYFDLEDCCVNSRFFQNYILNPAIRKVWVGESYFDAKDCELHFNSYTSLGQLTMLFCDDGFITGFCEVITNSVNKEDCINKLSDYMRSEIKDAIGGLGMCIK